MAIRCSTVSSFLLCRYFLVARADCRVMCCFLPVMCILRSRDTGIEKALLLQDGREAPLPKFMRCRMAIEPFLAREYSIRHIDICWLIVVACSTQLALPQQDLSTISAVSFFFPPCQLGALKCYRRTQEKKNAALLSECSELCMGASLPLCLFSL